MPAAAEQPAPPALDRFSGQFALEYDADIVRRVPGYPALQEIAMAVFTELAPEEAKVLIVGAGTGAELTRLASINANWTFVAVDPSSDMLSQAQQCVGPDVHARTEWIVDRAEHIASRVPHGSCDAAINLLVSHFIADDGGKDALFGAISTVLKMDAPLVSAELYRAMDPTIGAALHARWARLGGVPAASVDAMIARLQTAFHPTTAERFDDLLTTHGFARPTTFFEALRFRGTFTKRV